MSTLRKIVTNKKLICMLIMLIVVLVTLSMSTYTWFFKGGTLLTIEFQTGYIAMDIELYEGVDFDRDGILDTETEINGSAVTEYTPKYQMLAALETAGEGNPISLSGVPTATEQKKLPDIEVQVFQVGQTYTYKLEMTNYGDVKSFVELSLDGLEYLTSDTNGIEKLISVETFVEGTEGNSLEELRSMAGYENLYQGKHMLCGWDKSTPLVVASGVPFVVTGQDENNNEISKAVLIFRFKLEPMNVISPILQAQGETMEDYNMYMGKSFRIPNLNIRLYSEEI